MANKLYALIVGINRYFRPFRSLSGCIADAENMKQYLEEHEAHLNPEIRLLTNQGATKSEIIRNFREHFDKAEAGDTVLFYFAGHGQQERADREVWSEEGDGLLECIVCYNDPSINNYRLADKELRWLISDCHQQKPDVHIVLLFDNCHSSDNNRAPVILEEYPDAAPRRIGIVASKRSWDKFAFSDTFSEDDFKGQYLDDVLPEGKHIHLAACQPHEFAWEIGGQGIFTKNLIEVLKRCDGEISYYDLQRRIKYYVKEHKEQHPTIYARGTENTLLFQGFLGKDVETKPMGVRVYFTNGQLRIDMGAPNGISVGTEVVIELPDGAKVTTQVVSTSNEYSSLAIPAGAQLVQGQDYGGYIDGFMTAPLNIYVHDEDADTILVEELKNELGGIDNIHITDDAQADYALVVRNGRFSIHYPYDYARPLVETVPVPVEEQEDIQAIQADMGHIAGFKYVQEFRNENPTFFTNSSFIDLKIHAKQEDGSWALLEQTDRGFSLPTHLDNGEWLGTIKIELINTSEQTLYCALLYLPNTFGVYSLLAQSTTPIPAGTSIFAYGGEIPVFLEKHTVLYNWPVEEHTIKLMVSTEPNLNPEEFFLNDLPKPQLLDNDATVSDRGIGASPRSVSDWTTEEFGLHIPNRSYNKVARTTVEQMLVHPLLGEYALKLYFDERGYLRTDTIETVGGTVDADTDDLRETANTVAYNLRKNRFDANLAKYPDRPLMIAQGDAWLHHPLVKDVVNHLSEAYNICSLGVGNDDLEAYTNAEAFTNAINALSAQGAGDVKGLILSGGAHDIIGNGMRQYLNATPDQTNPSIGRYVKNIAFNKRLDQLIGYIRDIYTQVQAAVPGIQVFMHGYDFILPQANGLIGTYIAALGIEEDRDKKNLIRFMLEKYNNRLQTLAEQLPHFHYVDIRESVLEHQWHDERHPSTSGCKAIAERFKEVISAQNI